MPSEPLTVADVIVEELQARGVGFVATLNGHGLDPFYLACERANMRMVDVRNEQSASYIAEVTGRLSRSIGVCAVSGGVAHANAMTGVLNAWFDGAPMLLITGTTPHAELGWGNFQDFNPVPLAGPITKFARLVDVPHRAAQIVHEAITAATSGRPGPVHLSLPMDVASVEVDAQQVMRSPVRSGEVRISGSAEPPLVEQAAQLIERAERPLLLAGSGLYYARGEAALAQFASQLQIPTVVPIWDRGCVDQGLETFLGVIGAATGGPRLLPDSDLVILAGCEFDYRMGQLWPPGMDGSTSVIRIHADASRLRSGLEAHLSLQGSPATVLRQLTEVTTKSSASLRSAWMDEARRRHRDHHRRCLEAAAKLPAGTNGKDVVDGVAQVLTDDTVLLVDGGNIGQWVHQLLATDRYPGHWVGCGASGVVGWGLPGAMAARTLYPDRPVLLLSGDGAFTFTVAELECAARQSLGFVAIVADDELWGITVTGQMQKHGRALYSALGPTRLDQVAEGFGCRGVRVEEKAQLVPAIRDALGDTRRPTVLHVPIVPGSPAD